MTEHAFDAELWVWDARRDETWTFVTLPPETSAAVEDEAITHGPPRGFGSVRVEVRLGSSTWRTSVFPDASSGCYVLPIKKAVRRVEGVEAGDRASLVVRLVGNVG